ncbi:MAG: hypothetical protein ACM3ML_03815, partial [Micromonosporaceae bacterium]
LIVTRAAFPPALVNTTSRTVWLLKPAAETSPGAASDAGVAGAGLAPQLATQWRDPWEPAWLAVDAALTPLPTKPTANAAPLTAQASK